MHMSYVKTWYYIIERHKETLDLLSNTDWVKNIMQGKKEVKERIKGKSLDELED